jgi:uncharacterized membrane protein YhaH (DUF805 family)
VNNARVPLLLPLKRYAEFGGRSTRTEVLGFYLLTMIVGLVAHLIAGWLGEDRARPWLQAGLAAIFFLPTLTLFVRRLHDAGRSAWWLLIASPAVVAAIWEIIARPRPFTLNISMHLPWWAMVPAFLSGIAFWVQLLWPDDPDTNRYGPNPRCGPVGEPA